MKGFSQENDDNIKHKYEAVKFHKNLIMNFLGIAIFKTYNMKPVLIFFLIIAPILSFTQGIQQYKGKTYIFDSFEQAQECDALGGSIGATITMLKGTLFTVEKVPSATSIVIKFRQWKKNSPKNAIYNQKAPVAAGGSPTEVFFLLSKAIFDESCSEYKFEQKWDINFGVLTSPFKFRSKPFLFTTNLNLGTSVSYQKKFFKNWSWGVVCGLSLSNVFLDSFSTKGKVSSVTERPAVTPSFHGMIGYKSINLSIGVGWDLINKTSEIEQSWVYHGKRWVGIGIGVSLFASNSNVEATPKVSDQK